MILKLHFPCRGFPQLKLQVLYFFLQLNNLIFLLAKKVSVVQGSVALFPSRSEVDLPPHKTLNLTLQKHHSLVKIIPVERVQMYLRVGICLELTSYG